MMSEADESAAWDILEEILAMNLAPRKEIMARWANPMGRRMILFEVAIRAGNFGATLDALDYCRRHGVVAPGWLLLSAFDLAASAIIGDNKKKGPGGNLLARYRQDLKHMIRAETYNEVRDRQEEVTRQVEELEEGTSPDPGLLADRRAMKAAIGHTADDARAATSKLLAGTLAAGGEEAIASSCKKIKSGALGRYQMPTQYVLRKLNIADAFESPATLYEALGIPLPSASRPKNGV